MAVRMSIYISPGPTTCVSPKRSSIGFRNRKLTATQFQIISFEEDKGPNTDQLSGHLRGSFDDGSLPVPDMSISPF